MSHFIKITGGLQALEVPAQGTQKAGLVLIQEIFGVNANMAGLAVQYASHGFHVLVPDLFWRTKPLINLDPASAEDRQQAMALNAAFDDELGLLDLAECAQYLRGASRQPVFAVGYCLGGRLSFRLAGAGAVEASVSYYGVNIDKHLDNAHNTPRLVHIAQKDTLCPPESQRRIGDWAQGTSTAVHVYEDTQHAFARAGGPSYDEAAAELANQRTLAFLERLSGNAGANGWNGR